MNYIAITFAHGNGPYSRAVEWAVEVNNVRDERGLSRLPIIVPLVYPGRQEKIIQEEISANDVDFIKKHPLEILFDRRHGNILNRLMFKGNNYQENLETLARDYFKVEAEIKRHLESIRDVETLTGEKMEFDLKNSEMQLGINNRVQTGLPNQFYTTGGAGPFDEILERAIVDPKVKVNKGIMKNTLSIARRMIEGQRIIMSNSPGVFSYDFTRELRDNEILTPPFVHPHEENDLELPGKGIYLTVTGIDGVRESGFYQAAEELGLRLYTPEFMGKTLAPEIKSKIAGFLNPEKMNNPNIVAQYARAGWSSVWRSQICRKGFITLKYQEKDDPEMLFNERGIVKLGLGAVINEDPRKSLEESLLLADKVHEYNKDLIDRFETLDGIRYSAEKVANYMNY